MGVFHSAAIRVAQRSHAPYHLEKAISSDEWARVVIKGADERSHQSRHLLVLGGTLIGFSSQDEEALSPSLTGSLQKAFATATNMALERPSAVPLSDLCVALALNHAFLHLPERDRAILNYDRLLPLLMHTMLHSSDGLKTGCFLRGIDSEVHQVSARQFNWSSSSPTFHNIKAISSGPLVTSLGPLSRLIAHTIEHVRDTTLVAALVDDLAAFSTTLLAQWRRNKLSEVDQSEETEYLHEEARQRTIPVLWKLLRSTLFAVVIILRSAIGRVLGDGILASKTCQSSSPPQT